MTEGEKDGGSFWTGGKPQYDPNEDGKAAGGGKGDDYDSGEGSGKPDSYDNVDKPGWDDSGKGKG